MASVIINLPILVTAGTSQVALAVKNRLPVQEMQETGSVPGFRRSPGEGHGKPLQYSCLEKIP